MRTHDKQDASRKPVSETALVSVLAALSDPVRLEILCRLDSDGPTSCSELRLQIPLPTLSRHLNALRHAGIVVTVAEGTRRINSIAGKEFEERFPGLLDTVLQLAHRRESIRHTGTRR